MAVVISPDSELGREMAKWNKPYRYEAFPKMLYKARQRPDGRHSLSESDDRLFGGAPGAAEQFTGSCQRTVNDEHELQLAYSQGYRPIGEAMAYCEAEQRAIADAAAHRHYEDRNLSDAAKREMEKFDVPGSMQHVPEIPVAPKRRGRPKKEAAA